jgi:NADH-quinone oxidoreductase subunit C
MARIILERLKARFGADVLETSSQHGDDVVVVTPGRWREAAEFVRTDPQCACDYFVDLSAVDCCDNGDAEARFEVYVIAYSIAKKHRVRLKVRLPEDHPELDTLIPVWAGANWMERECFDMFGVRFKGHPDLRRILLYEEFQGHPLRKDYPAQRAQPLVSYREGTHDKLGPFLKDEGMPLDRSRGALPEPD